MAACHARPADKPAGPWPGSPVQLRRRLAATRGNGAHAMRARGVITVRSSRVRASAVMHSTTAWWGLVGEHRWGPRVAQGRWSGGGAHPSGGSACGGGAGCRHSGGGQRRGRRGGAVDGRRGRELQVRCRSREGESRRGGESSAGGGGVPYFLIGGRRGGSGGGVRGVGRRVEAERGKAKGQAWRGNGSAAGSGPWPAGAGDGVVARQWMAAGSGRCGTARLTGGPG
jgi:hypothetical protein